MTRSRESKASVLKVGQHVSVPMVIGSVLAEVVEDRGFIGYGGRQIVCVRTLNEFEDLRRTFEVPAAEVTIVE